MADQARKPGEGAAAQSNGTDWPRVVNGTDSDNQGGLLGKTMQYNPKPFEDVPILDPEPNIEQCVTRTKPLSAPEALLRLPPFADSPLDAPPPVTSASLNMTSGAAARSSNLTASTETIMPPAWEPLPPPSSFRPHTWDDGDRRPMSFADVLRKQEEITSAVA